ncbi:MAG: azurin, partial [Verrucomicrobiales bacterium]
ALAQAKADDKKEPAKEEKAKEEKKEADVKVAIEGNDTMQYNTTAFSATEGQTVELTFKNVGKLPKIAMGHNVVLLTKGTDMMGFATKAMGGGPTNDYLPQDKESQAKMIAHTKLLGPGESETMTFTAPAAGKYDYICTFPGHVAIMKGVMTVEAKKEEK